MTMSLRTIAVISCAVFLGGACDQSAPGATFDPQAGRCVAADDATKDELEVCKRRVTEVRATLGSVAAAQSDAQASSYRHLASMEELAEAGVEIPESVSLRVGEVNSKGTASKQKTTSCPTPASCSM